MTGRLGGAVSVTRLGGLGLAPLCLIFGPGDWTQDLILARQALTLLSYLSLWPLIFSLLGLMCEWPWLG